MGFLYAHSVLRWTMSKIFDFELKLKKLRRKTLWWGKIKIHKILEKRWLLSLTWFPMAQYGCPIEPFGLLMRPLWTPFGPVWTNYRPQMALFGQYGQYGHLWPSYGSLRVWYGQIGTHLMALMAQLWPLIAANMNPYGVSVDLLWSSMDQLQASNGPLWPIWPPLAFMWLPKGLI